MRCIFQVFSTEAVGNRGSQTHTALVSKAFIDGNDAIEVFMTHMKAWSNKGCISVAEYVLDAITVRKCCVICQINVGRKRRMEENLRKASAIIRVLSRIV